MVRSAPSDRAISTSYDAYRTMKRFTVSLPDDLYAEIRQRGDRSTPPASLQQMIRYAVDSLLTPSDVAHETETTLETSGSEEASPAPLDSVDLLVFDVGDVTYGIAIELVETVAAGLMIHSVPSTSGTLAGMAVFRDTLTEVHNGGTVLQGHPLAADEAGSLLAVPGEHARVLMTVTTVDGLTPARETRWAAPPVSAPPWVSALAWTDERVIAVIDPRSFNL